MKVGSDDAQWIEAFRLRRLYGEMVSDDEVAEARLRRARLRGRAALTDQEWRRLEELSDRWHGGGMDVRDPDWDEWRSLDEIAREWRRRRRLPLLKKVKQRFSER